MLACASQHRPCSVGSVPTLCPQLRPLVPRSGAPSCHRHMIWCSHDTKCFGVAPVLRKTRHKPACWPRCCSPGQEASIADLARETGSDPGNLHAEVERLVQAGILATASWAHAIVACRHQHAHRPAGKPVLLATGPRPWSRTRCAANPASSRLSSPAPGLRGTRAEPGAFPNDVDVIVVGKPDRDAVTEAVVEALRTAGHDGQVIFRTPSAWRDPKDAFTRTAKQRPGRTDNREPTMASWPTRPRDDQRLIAAGIWQKVAPSLEAAHGFLAPSSRPHRQRANRRRTQTRRRVLAAFDAARKSLAAVLQAQGLRATSKGGHYAIQEAIDAQFTQPPPARRSAPSRTYGEDRNQVEYEDNTPITADDVDADTAVVRTLHAVAGRWSTPFQCSPIDDADSSSPLPRTTRHRGLSEMSVLTRGSSNALTMCSIVGRSSTVSPRCAAV